MNKIIPIIIAVVVVAGGAGFFAGMTYAKGRSVSGAQVLAGLANLTPAERQARFQQFGASGTGGMMRGGRNGAGFTAGEIISKDDKSITIKLQDGGSRIIFLGASTGIMKSVEGAVSDLTIGETVTVNGSSNQDGSLTAQSVQIRAPRPASTNNQ